MPFVPKGGGITGAVGQDGGPIAGMGLGSLGWRLYRHRSIMISDTAWPMIAINFCIILTIADPLTLFLDIFGYIDIY